MGDHLRDQRPERGPNAGDEAPRGGPHGRAPHSGSAARLRNTIYRIIETGRGESALSQAFDVGIVTLILLNVAAFVAETVPSLHAAYGAEFLMFETVSVGIFTVEYALRLWTAVEVPFLSRLPPWRARLSAALQPALVIDLLAILPFYLGHLLAIDLRVLRVLRLLRFLKLSRYSPAMHTLLRVLWNERRSLAGAAILLCSALLFASTGIYLIEGQVQPDQFGSVPQASWWAIATLTTVGYGDITPITPLGRLFGGFVMVMGLCILALPVAIISTGFAQEAQRRDFVVNWSLMSRIPMLARLDAREVGEIMPYLHANNVPPKVEIIAAGEPSRAIYFIASGRIASVGSGARTFGPGECVGAQAMVLNDINALAFVTQTKCRLLKLHAEDFHRIEVANPGFADEIRRHALGPAHQRHS
ncbi:MAG: cyclic nucleotide-gated ion channel [Hyphomicrobium sp.]|nr:cyclic nucleotide-gated ion channel [Hyphomicrobium sp.]